MVSKRSLRAGRFARAGRLAHAGRAALTVAAGLAMGATAAYADPNPVPAFQPVKLCGEVSGLADGFGNVTAGEVCLDVATASYGAGESNKVTVVRGARNGFTFEGTGTAPRVSCELRDGSAFGRNDTLVVGTGSRAECTATVGNGPNRNVQAFDLLPTNRAASFAVPAFQSRTICDDFDLTDGFGNRSAGEVCLNVATASYGAGESNKLTLVRRARNGFVVTPAMDVTPGEAPSLRCELRDGSVFGGNDRLVAGTGSFAECAATIGNGPNARSQAIELR